MLARARSPLILPLAALVILFGLLLPAGREALARPMPEPQAATIAPRLALPALASATAGQPVELPLTFDPGSHAIDTIFFVLSYDATLLTLDDSDANGDGIPDSLTVNLPAGYRVLSSLEHLDEGQRVCDFGALGQVAVHPDFRPVAEHLEYGRAGQADDGVAPPLLAALHRLEEIGIGPLRQFAVAADGRFQIGQHFDADRYAIVVCRQCGKFLRIHGLFPASWARISAITAR